MQNIAVILAGGRGSRMCSLENKVLAKICNKPIINYLIDELLKLELQDIYVVLGCGADDVKKALPKKIKTVLQTEQLGTGDALKTAVKDLTDFDGNILLLNGDGPIISEGILREMLDLKDAKMKLFTGKLTKNSLFGRLKRENSAITGIIEAKDCTPEELLIEEQNLGIYCFDNKILQKYIYSLGCDNSQHEYYVTDLVERFALNNYKVDAYIKKESDFYLPSMNTLVELVDCQAKMQHLINNKHLSNGVKIVCPNNANLDIYTKIGKYSTIYPNVNIENSTLDERVIVEPNCVIKNCVISAGVVVGANSVLYNCKIDKNIAPLTCVNIEKNI